jgi:hypothetical protein
LISTMTFLSSAGIALDHGQAQLLLELGQPARPR